MKRQWKLWRLVEAVALLSVAWLFVASTRTQPLWRVPYDMARDHLRLLRVHEDRRIVYTYYQCFDADRDVDKRTAEFRGYDLDTGQIVWKYRDPTMSRDELWEYSISPDLAWLACIQRAEDVVELRRFPSMELVHKLQVPHLEVGETPLGAFTTDSRHLMLLSRKSVRSYDVESAKPEWDIPLLTLPVMSPLPTLPKAGETVTTSMNPNQEMAVESYIDSRGSYLEAYECIQLGGDRRFLVLPCVSGKNGTLVIHVPTRQIIARLPYTGIPHFDATGTRLAILNQYMAKELPHHQPQWFTLTDTGVQPCAPASARVDGVTLHCERDALWCLEILIRDMRGPSWLTSDWIPENMRMRLAELLGVFQCQAKLRRYQMPDNEPGNIFQVPFNLMALMSFGAHRCTVTSQGDVLLLNTGMAMEVWSLPPRRPRWAWMALLCVVIFCMWRAWPRRRLV